MFDHTTQMIDHIVAERINRDVVRIYGALNHFNLRFG
jgi:hypothetical protein